MSGRDRQNSQFPAQATRRCPLPARRQRPSTVSFTIPLGRLLVNLAGGCGGQSKAGGESAAESSQRSADLDCGVPCEGGGGMTRFLLVLIALSTCVARPGT